jgi:hypothetical protein
MLIRAYQSAGPFSHAPIAPRPQARFTSQPRRNAGAGRRWISSLVAAAFVERELSQAGRPDGRVGGSGGVRAPREHTLPYVTGCSCLLHSRRSTGRVSLPVLRTSAPLLRHTSTRASASMRSKAPSQVEWSSSVKLAPGIRQAEADGTPVSLLVFPSICFALWVSPMSATGRRPVSRPFESAPLSAG